MPDGFEIIFAHGFFDLKSEDYEGKVCLINVPTGAAQDPRNGLPAFDVYKAEFDALIKVGNPLLYIQGSQPEALPKVRDSMGRTAAADEHAKSEAELLAGTLAEARVGGVVRGEDNKGVTTSDPNASTVDPALRAAVLKPAVTAAERIAQAKADAAQRASANSSTGVAQ